MANREHGVVLFGATGFVGRLTARYLAGLGDDLPIALAGRSRDKLEETRSALGPGAAAWPLLVADSSDPTALASLARSATVVATTVGPYARYGLGLVEACAAAGTHYCDLTGEVLFVRECIERFHDVASGKGARIVHSCGYDSVPSDLGVLLLHDAAGDGVQLTETVHRADGRGGFSGGTIDSFRNQVDTVREHPGKRTIVEDPYSLSPDRAAEPDLGPQPDLFRPRRDRLLGEWVAPFIMGSYNTRIVRRSNALTGWAYGRRFSYREVMGFGTGPTGPLLAGAVTAGLAVAAGGMTLGWTRPLLDRILPEPGEGPSQKTMDSGWFRSTFRSVASDGRRLQAVVAAEGDPGYKATAVMLAESALALAHGDDLPDRAGVLTPATGVGHALVRRLSAAGFTLDAGPAGTDPA